MKQKLIKSKLVRLPLSGSKATIYSVLEIRSDGRRSMIFERFITDHQEGYQSEVMDVLRRLQSIGKKTGALPIFFKMNEGLETDDMVCALFDVPDKHLRLYCIRVSEKILILGGGGPKTTRTWQEDPVLRKAVHRMMEISVRLRTKINNGDLTLSGDRLFIAGGNLILEE